MPGGADACFLDGGDRRLSGQESGQGSAMMQGLLEVELIGCPDVFIAREGLGAGHPSLKARFPNAASLSGDMYCKVTLGHAASAANNCRLGRTAVASWVLGGMRDYEQSRAEFDSYGN